MAIHQLELNWIRYLQNGLRGSFTDTFFIYWDFVDTIWFVLTFVAIIMYLFNRKEGISLLFIFIISSIVNLLLKKYFNLPRPCQIDPLIGILCHKSSGFPSGAAQTATIIIGVAFAKCHQNIYKILAALFALFLCFSRIYLGLHFFTDILGGIVVGMGLLAIYLTLFPFLENHWAKFAFGLSFLILILGGTKMISQAAMTFGIATGFLFLKQNKLSASWFIRILILLVVILGSSFFLYLGETHVSIKPLAVLLAGFWFSYLGNWVVSACSNQLKIL